MLNANGSGGYTTTTTPADGNGRRCRRRPGALPSARVGPPPLLSPREAAAFTFARARKKQRPAESGRPPTANHSDRVLVHQSQSNNAGQPDDRQHDTDPVQVPLDHG